MLLSFVILYLALSVGIGLYAATRVHNTKDFAVAGRCLPLPVVTATVFCHLVRGRNRARHLCHLRQRRFASGGG